MSGHEHGYEYHGYVPRMYAHGVGVDYEASGFVAHLEQAEVLLRQAEQQAEHRACYHAYERDEPPLEPIMLKQAITSMNVRKM